MKKLNSVSVFFALAAFSSVGSIGLAKAQAPKSKGHEIVRHSVYPEMSKLVDSLMLKVSRKLVGLNEEEAARVAEDFQYCVDKKEGCESILTYLDLQQQDMDQVTSYAVTIARDVKLRLEEVESSFRGAQILYDGLGLDGRLAIFPERLGLSCGRECTENSANILGTIKSSLLSRLVLGKIFNVGVFDAIFDFLDVVKRLRDWINDIIPSNNNRDECFQDGDCGRNEYCHVMGVNDCRPKRGLNSLCTRDAQCASGRCVPWIGHGFLLTCRP